MPGGACYKATWKSEYLENFQGRVIRTLAFRGGAEKPSWGAGSQGRVRGIPLSLSKRLEAQQFWLKNSGLGIFSKDAKTFQWVKIAFSINGANTWMDTQKHEVELLPHTMHKNQLIMCHKSKWEN